jgi:hypothetical protein
MTGGLVDPNLREALFLLNEAVTAFFEEDGSTLAPGEVTPTAAAPDHFTAEFIVWLTAMFEAKTVDRRELEEIFSDAEGKTRSPAVLKAISDIWDKVLAMMPQAHEDECVSSAAEVTGDYSRLYFSKPVVRLN